MDASGGRVLFLVTPMISNAIKNHDHLKDITVSDFLDFFWKECVTGASLVDMDNKWVSPNPKICGLLGYPASRLEEMTWRDVTIEPDRAEDMIAVRAVITGEMSHYVMDKTYQARGGSLIRARLTVKPIRGANRDVAMLLSQVQEIDGVPVGAADELRVVWDFVGKHKKSLGLLGMTYTVGVALAGDSALVWFKSVIEVVTSLGSGG